MEFFEALVMALASRPEILGIATISGIMAWMVKRRKGNKSTGNKTPMFDHVIKVQGWGILLLGAVLVIREIGHIIGNWPKL